MKQPKSVRRYKERQKLEVRSKSGYGVAFFLLLPFHFQLLTSFMTDNSHALPSTGRVAGIDYGTMRIGVAVTDSRRTLASPLANYTRGGPEADSRYFRQLAREEQVVLFVVGLPVHLAGHESNKSLEARRFAQWLGETTGVRVVFSDERFTSSEADTLLAQGELTSKKRKQRRDMLAAQIMLSGWLEAGQPMSGELLGLDEG